MEEKMRAFWTHVAWLLPVPDWPRQMHVCWMLSIRKHDCWNVQSQKSLAYLYHLLTKWLRTCIAFLGCHYLQVLPHCIHRIGTARNAATFCNLVLCYFCICQEVLDFFTANSSFSRSKRKSGFIHESTVKLQLKILLGFSSKHICTHTGNSSFRLPIENIEDCTNIPKNWISVLYRVGIKSLNGLKICCRRLFFMIQEFHCHYNREFLKVVFT